MIWKVEDQSKTLIVDSDDKTVDTIPKIMSLSQKYDIHDIIVVFSKWS